jgi:hypothetical protein
MKSSLIPLSEFLMRKGARREGFARAQAALEPELPSAGMD